MEFFNWDMLGSFAGAVFAVAVLTQITKEIPPVKSVPTQLWSYILSLITLVLSLLFGGNFDAGGLVLCLFNAALVSLAANGGYEALSRLKEGVAGV